MAYQLTPIPYSLRTADGFLVKTDKSKSYHLLTKNLENAELPPEEETLTVIDGNAVFHAMVQVPQTFQDMSINLNYCQRKATSSSVQKNLFQSKE